MDLNDKRWPANLAVPSLNPARGGEIFSAANGVSLQTAFHNSSAYRPDMTEMLLKRTKKSQVIHPSIHCM